jgi:hypothetical protein
MVRGYSTTALPQTPQQESKELRMKQLELFPDLTTWTPEEEEVMQQMLNKGANGTSALDVQVAGNHYKDLAIQPVEYIHANGIGYFEGNVIKYVSRWKAKNGIKDLEKAKHYIELLIELEEKTNV